MSGQPTITIPVVYGVGSGGSRLAATLVHGRGPGGRWIAQRLSGVEAVCISSSRMDIEQLKGYQQRGLYVIGDGTGSGMNPEKGRRDYLESPSRQEILELPKKIAEEKGYDRIDLVPVIATLGFGCGSGAGPALLEDLVKKYPNSCVLGIFTLPFAWEGDETRRRAVKALQQACKHAPVIPASNSYLIRDFMDTDFTKALNTANERIVKPLNTVLRAMSNPKAITVIDSSDLRRILKPAPVIAMTYTLPTPAEIQNLSQHDSSMLSPIAKGLNKISCLAVMEAGRGQLTPQHVEALPEQLRDVLGSQPIEVKTLLARRPESEKTYVSILVGGVELHG
ncbi:MAG: hypothetical protein QXU87_08800 [Candidatus Caldarchaeum sp.]